MSFSERLRKLRAASGLTQQKVADNLGITKVGYQYYEYGKKLPGFGVLGRIADLFDVSADYLLMRTNELRLPMVCGQYMIKYASGEKNGI